MNWFDDKVCKCDADGYRFRQDLCGDCDNHPDKFCSPYTCIYCGKWSGRELQYCKHCKQFFYGWFDFRRIFSPDLYPLCWDCRVLMNGGVIPKGSKLPPNCVVPSKIPFEDRSRYIDSLLDLL